MSRTSRIFLGWLGHWWIALHGVAQNSDPAPALWGSVYADLGPFSDHRVLLFRGDAARLLAGNAFATQDMSGYRFRSDVFPAPAVVFSATMGIHPFRGLERRGPEWRVGALVTSHMAINASYEHTVRVPYDTLTSSQTGQVTLVDSLYTTRYEVSHRYAFAGLQADLILRTKRRFSVFGGLGVAGGLLYNAHTELSLYERAFTEEQAHAPGPLDGAEPDQQDRVRNGSGIWWSLQVPMGIDYRLHRSHSWWARLHIYQQLTIQMLYVERPVLGYTGGMGVRSTVGLRFHL